MMPGEEQAGGGGGGGGEAEGEEAKENGEEETSDTLALPRCEDIRLELDPMRAVLEDASSRVLRHAVSAQHPFVDALVRDGDVLYALQATVRDTHSCDSPALAALLRRARAASAGIARVHVLYVVPMDNFKAFKTKPGAPVVPGDGYCTVSVVGVPRPQHQPQSRSRKRGRTAR